jgi:hypothetical protein
MKQISIIPAVVGSFLASSVLAAPVYQPPGANLVVGHVAFGPRASSTMGNPATGAEELDRLGDKAKTVTGLSVSAGIEYGNVDDILELIEELGASTEPSPPGTGDPGETPPDGGIEIPIPPELEAAVKAIAKEVGARVGVLALVQAEGYGKAFVSTDIPIALGREHLGGAWEFGINLSGTSTVFGLAESIEFDVDEAREQLENILFDVANNDPKEVYPIGGDDVLITVDPDSGNVKIRFDNDSTLLTKAATTAEFSTSYSREIWSGTSGKLYGGIDAKFYRVGLSRVSTRLGDITDSSELWESIKDSDLDYSNDVGADLGVIWSGGNYHLGATLTNINEPEFKYPDVDTSNYKDPDVIAFLERDDSYVMERQLRLEGSVHTADKHWGVAFGLDANKVPDPLGYKYQWASISASYNTDSFWLPSVRFGYRKNLAGTRLNYLGAGVTAFKYVNLDVASSFDTTSINGTTLPRSLMVNLGFNAAF